MTRTATRKANHFKQLGAKVREGVKADPRLYQSDAAIEAAAKAKAPSPAAVETALTKLQTIPGPAPLPRTEAERDAVLARVVPPRKTWHQAPQRGLRLAGRALYRFVELIGEAMIAVAGPLLTAAVDALAVLVFILTIWELWTPAKAIADHVAAALFG